ncbi:MAG: hypothetical protein ABIU09_08720 [Pyrinomonadaceae bacterium]
MTGKIKVIKRNAVSTPVTPAKADYKTKRQAAREAVSTVTNWVTDFKARKRDETKAAIEMLLVSKPQANEL